MRTTGFFNPSNSSVKLFLFRYSLLRQHVGEQVEKSLHRWSSMKILRRGLATVHDAVPRAPEYSIRPDLVMPPSIPSENPFHRKSRVNS